MRVTINFEDGVYSMSKTTESVPSIKISEDLWDRWLDYLGEGRKWTNVLAALDEKIYNEKVDKLLSQKQ